MLRQHLEHQSQASSKRTTTQASFTPPIPPIPSPNLPSGIRSPFSPSSLTNIQNLSISRRKSFGLAIKKPESDLVKLPKEFLIDFWNVLKVEQGDPGWDTAVNGFLGMIKKGTKTGSGMNLREVPTLLDGQSFQPKKHKVMDWVQLSPLISYPPVLLLLLRIFTKPISSSYCTPLFPASPTFRPCLELNPRKTRSYWLDFARRCNHTSNPPMVPALLPSVDK